MSGRYTDWHPAWQTIFSFTIPLKLTGQIGATIVFPVLYFALAIGYMGYVIHKHAGTWPTVLSVGYIGLNPYIFRVLMYPWKDIPFGVAGLVALLMAIELHFSAEKKNKRWYLILLGFVAANAAIFRHNGILFAAPLVLIILFSLPKKRMLYLALSFLLTFVMIKVPFYRLLNVQQPGSRVVETTGLPMTVIANVAKENPESMDEELTNFVYSIADPETWERSITGNFNSIKWSPSDLSPIEKAGHGKVIRWMFQCFSCSPESAFRGLFALTDMVYGPEAGLDGNVGSERITDMNGMAYAGSEILLDFLDHYQAVFDHSLFRYIRTYGIALVVLLLFFLAKLKASSWKSWKKLLLVAPIFAYDFGTMLLLTGSDSRFFWITFLITPLLLVFMTAKDEESSPSTESQA